MPTRGTAGASGYDLYAPEGISIDPGRIVVVHSGVSIELPDATWEAQVRGRSGMNRRGLVVLLGTVDSDYRGVCGATIHNVTRRQQGIKRGDRIAQLVFSRVEHPDFIYVDNLSETTRGSGGFGSTGR